MKTAPSRARVTRGILRWSCGDADLRVKCPDALEGTAIAFPRADCVGVLFGGKDGVVRAAFYCLQNAGRLAVIDPPRGFAINHLTRHPAHEPMMMCCSIGDSIDGHYDWYFSVNLKHSETTRQGQAR